MRLSTARSSAALATLAMLGAVATGCSSTSAPGSSPATRATSSPSPTDTGTPAGGASPTDPGGQASTPVAPHATEFNPPGDIPDNAVFVDHTAPGSSVHLTVPEGWARSRSAGVTTFTDTYNSISIEVRRRRTAPSPASARKEDLPELRGSVSNFTAGQITVVSRRHGSAVHLSYLLDSVPNPVTDKVVRDVAERFEFWHAGEEAILTLTGPEHADNVDPWQIVSDSLQW